MAKVGTVAWDWDEKAKGRWTKEKIEEEAEAFLEWIDRPGNFIFKKFALERKYSSRYLPEWAEKNERFRQVYQRARDKQETTILEYGLMKKFDSHLSKFMLSAHYGYAENTENQSRDESSPSSKAIADVKEVCVQHTKSLKIEPIESHLDKAQ